MVESLLDGKRGKAASAFLRVYEHPMSTGRRVYWSEKRAVFEPHDTEIAGEGNDQVAVEGSSDGNPYNDIIQQQIWNLR